MTLADVHDKVTPIVETAAKAAAIPVSRTARSLDGAVDINVGPAERLLSVAGSVLLFGWGIYRRGLLGYGAMMTAAALWDRGMRGHCVVYSALGKTTAVPGSETAAASVPSLP
jgi:hypothetical protein